MSFKEWYATNHEQLCNMTVKEAFKKAYEAQEEPNHYQVGDVVHIKNSPKYYLLALIEFQVTEKYLVAISLGTGHNHPGFSGVKCSYNREDRVTNVTEACERVVAKLVDVEKSPVEHIGHISNCIEVHHELL